MRRKVDGSDSRAVRVFITEAGRAKFETLWPHMAGTFETLVEGIDAEERRAFVATLQKIHGNIRGTEG